MEQNQIDQGIRLKKLIKALDINQISFSKSLGMAQPNISRIINGGSNISNELLNRISARYIQVNLHWLITGVGAMFFDAIENTSPQVNEAQAAYGKGRLEELEERVETLEAVVKKLIKDSGK